MKYMKIMILAITLLLLTGCGWSDVQDKYEDLLNQNISCTYYTEEKSASDDFFGVGTMVLSADYNGFYLNLNNNKKIVLYDNNGENTYLDFPTQYVYMQTDFKESYFKKYLENNSCPSTIYIYMGGDPYFSVNSCDGIGACSSYVLKQNQVTDENGEKIDCHCPNAVACAKTSTENTKPKYYLEFGYYKKSNGTISKYFGVSSDKNYKNMETAIDDDELTVYENLSFFTVTSDASKEIYLSNNKFIAMDKLIIKPTVTTNTTYFITGPNSTNYGDLDEVGNEEVPNIDPDNSEIENTPQEDLDITEVEVCGAGTTSLLVFQVIGYIILIIKILVPIILIVLGSIDLGKASLSGDDKAVKEAAISFAKRVLIGLIIFFVPTILDFFLGLVEGTTDVSSKYRGCTDCVLNPNNSSKCSPKKLNDNNSAQDGVSTSGKF